MTPSKSIKEDHERHKYLYRNPSKGDTEFKVRGDPDSIKAVMRARQLKITARRNMNNEVNERTVRRHW